MSDEFRFSGRDINVIEGEINDKLTRFLPEITDTSQANPGRRFLSLIAGLVDVLGFSNDMSLLESMWGTSQQKRNLVEQAKGIGWYYPGVSSAKVTLTFTSTTGPAGVGGIVIPQYLVCTTQESPARKFVTLETGLIAEGQTTTTVTAIEGERVVDQILTLNSSGALNQRYMIPADRVPFETVNVKVSGTDWTQIPKTLINSTPVEEVFVCRILEQDLLKTTILFGNNEFGKSIPLNSEIRVTYIKGSGPDGNVAANTITKIVGPLSSSLSVTNLESAAGGSDGYTVEEIRAKAPFEQQTRDVYVTAEDFRAGAESVPGVFTAIVTDVLGSTATVYVLPDGGGIAPQSLLDSVKAKLQGGTLIGAIINVYSIQLAEILVTADVTLLRTDISRQEARELVQNAILDAVDYTQQTIGRGFRISDMGALIDSLGDGNLVDFVDITRLTRIPRPVYTGSGVIPQIQGQIQVGTSAQYASYKIVGKTGDPTRFVIDQVDPNVASVGEGIIGTEFTSPDQSLKFTLGKPGETMTNLQTITFSTSRYRGNLRISNAEIMALSNLNQLAINVYYPGESDPFA